jgi:cytochrome c553
MGVGPNPPLAGMDAAAFASALNDYKSGAREHMMMSTLAKKMSDEDIADLAAYYGSLK